MKYPGPTEPIISLEDGQFAAPNRPLIVGEVLYDHFPDGRQILGGAPFNVAWNLQGLGLNPMFVSSVGADPEGEQVMETMAAWKMDVGSVRIHPDKPTGRVRVSFHRGEPSYDIVPEQAYDSIDFDLRTARLSDDSQNISLLYHGSLAWRGNVTRQSITQLREAGDLPVFVDLNIRQPWFEESWIEPILRGVTWLKLNVHELSQLTQRKLDDFSSQSEIASALQLLRARYGFEVGLVTAGPRGAFAVDRQKQVLVAANPGEIRVIDTVGAGDAFSAMAIAELTKGSSLDDLLHRAVGFARQICQIRGATSNEPHVYQWAIR